MTQKELHSIFMESETAMAHAQEICAAFGVQFPPDGADDSAIELAEEVAA